MIYNLDRYYYERGRETRTSVRAVRGEGRVESVARQFHADANSVDESGVKSYLITSRNDKDELENRACRNSRKIHRQIYALERLYPA